MKLFLIFFVTIIFTVNSFSQDLQTRYSDYGKMIVTHLHNASFPDTARAEGHTYKDVLYSAKDHYQDSTVAAFIPNNFKQNNALNIVVYFHGWNNNVDSTYAHYNLVDQFVRSNVNAILVVPEGPKNSPDSYGGKLEYKNGFKKFIAELIDTLNSRKAISTHKIGKIILCGHSGAYHVMSFILMRGGLSNYIKEVYLLDALYAEKEKYIYWFDHYNGKLIDIFTETGGTKSESEKLMDDLSGWNIPYVYKTEDKITPFDLANNKLVFIYTDLRHNQVPYARDEFKKFLSASCLERIK